MPSTPTHRSIQLLALLLPLAACGPEFADEALIGETTEVAEGAEAELSAGRTLNLSGQLSPTAGAAWKTHEFYMSGKANLRVVLDWKSAGANLNVFLYDPSGALQGAANGSARPEIIAQPAQTLGWWKIGIKCNDAATAYTLRIEATPLTAPGPGPQPEPEPEPEPTVPTLTVLPQESAMPGTPAFSGESGATNVETEGNYKVDTLVYAPKSGRVFIGGNFTGVIGGPARTRLAAMVHATGALDPSFAPAVNGLVRGLALSSDEASVFAVGDFTQAAGSARSRVAKFDARTGALSAWTADANGTVYGVAVHGNVVYLAGTFSSVKGTTRNALAALDATTGALLPFNPDVSGNNARSIVVSKDGARIFIGGNFTGVGGQPRENVAVIDAASGRATPWVPTWGADANHSAEHPIWEVALSPDERRIYVAVGGGGKVGGNRCKAYDLSRSTGDNELWFHSADGDHQTVAATANHVYCGGHFDNVSGAGAGVLKKLYAVHADTGALATQADGTFWDAGLNSVTGAHAILPLPGALLVGGAFTQPRQALARFNAP